MHDTVLRRLIRLAYGVDDACIEAVKTDGVSWVDAVVALKLIGVAMQGAHPDSVAAVSGQKRSVAGRAVAGVRKASADQDRLSRPLKRG